jgi:hypothetical protein
MLKLKRVFTILMFSPLLAIAQPGGDLGQLELSVTDKYKAQVADASKILDFPSFKDSTTQKLQVNYGITSTPIEVRFTPKSLPPVKIAQIEVPKIPRGLVRIGYGLYNTPLAEFYYNSGRSSKYSFGFSGKHLSTQTGVDDIIFENNGMSKNELGAYLNRFYKKVAWQTSAYASFNKVSYYGVDRFSPRNITQKVMNLEPDANWYRQFGISTALVSTKAKSMGWLTQSELEYYNLTDDYASMENFVKVKNHFSIPAEDNTIETDLNVTYFGTQYDSIQQFNQGFFTVQAKPKVQTVYKDVRIDFGLNFYNNSGYDTRNESTTNKTYFFPELKISYPIVKDVLTTYGGVTGELKHNTIHTLVTDNPFVQPGQMLTPTGTTDIFIGLTGILSSTTSFNLKGGFMRADDFLLYLRNPLYYTDTVDGGVNTIYDDMDIFYAKGELAVNLKNNLQLNLAGELRSYNPELNNNAWHLPAFTAELDALYTLKEKIKLKSKLLYVGSREAFEQSLNNELESKLPAYLDVNLGVEYLYNSRLSAFIDINNLLNSDYTYYLGYNTQRINVLFGLSYQF